MGEGLLTFPHHNWVPRDLPLPWQLSSSEPKAWWCRKDRAASASPSCSAALTWGIPVHRGASGSEALAIKTQQLLALCPSLPSPAGLGISNKRPLCTAPCLASSNSERRCCLSISCSVTCSTASWRGGGWFLWKPGLQRNCCSCYWNPLSDFCSRSRKFWKRPWRSSRLCVLQAWATQTNS